MPTFQQRSFAGGEIAPALFGRGDTAKFQTALRTCRNFLVQRYGGVANRPGTVHLGRVEDDSLRHRLVPFVFNDDQTYVLVFGDLTMQVVRLGVLLPAGGPAYTLATPYAAADLAGLSFVQSADVVTITSRDHPPRELRRTGHTAWALALATFAPAISRPTACAGVAGGAGGNTYRYRITAVSSGQDQEESLAGVQAAVAITGATQANPCVITAVGHGYATGDDVLIEGVGGMTQLNGKAFRVTVLTANTCSLLGIDATAYTAYTAGGTAKRTSVVIAAAAVPSSGAPHVLSWTAVAGAREYNIYREVAGIYGYIATAAATTFSDDNITPETAYTPPQESSLFTQAGDYPATATYVQQRRAYAGTDNDPEDAWLSRTGAYTNFTASSPVQDDDSVNFTLAGRQVQEVRHLVEVGKLVVLTSGGEWTIEGGADGAIRPTEINARLRGYNGAASQPQPVVIGDSLLYVQARGSVVRDLAVDDAVNGYRNRDLTLYAPHLFDGYAIEEMAFAQIPHSVLWLVRDDGALLGLTYIRDQEVWGWHRHDTGDGDAYESVAVVPEGDEDAVYVIVRRTINGATQRHIERFASRRVQDITAANFLDDSLAYDGTNLTATTLALTGGTTWSNTEDLTLTASGALFTAGDVGNRFILTSGTSTAELRVIGYTSATVVTVRAVADVPVPLRAAAILTWAKAVDEFAGLDHLEGRRVAVLADGHVVSDGADATVLTVSGGAVTLPRPYTKVRIGLPITADLQTLDIDVPDGAMIGRRKRVNRVHLLVEASRGIFAGPDTGHLTEHKQRTTEPMGTPTALTTGVIEVPITTTWTDGGSIAIRQRAPLPLTVLSIAPAGDIGG